MADDEAGSLERTYREFNDWMQRVGKKPEKHVPLASSTASNYLDRLDRVHRSMLSEFQIERVDQISTELSDRFVYLLEEDEIRQDNGEPYDESSKGKKANSLEKYHLWQFHEGELSREWESPVTFSRNDNTSAYRFTYRELGKLLDVAEEYGSLPSFYEASEEEREQINALVAQRLRKPKETITREDWLQADESRKVSSLITVSYDAGLTPTEIASATVGWYHPQNQMLIIPAEHASKEREREEVALSEKSVASLSKWLKERRQLEKYDGTKKLWLNREGNPYSSGSLCNLIRKLCELADIPIEKKPVRWYSLRHTLGRNVTAEGELSQTNDQLRHESFETTQRTYNQTPIEQLQYTLKKTHGQAERAAADPEYEPFGDEQIGSVGHTVSESVKRNNSNEITTQTDAGGVHVDAIIPDTTEARSRVAREILGEPRD